MNESESRAFQHFCNVFSIDIAVLGDLNEQDQKLKESILAYVRERFSRMKYILGLAIDFVVICELISQLDTNYSPFPEGSTFDGDIEPVYTRVKQIGKKKANTLTFEVNGSKVGIRKVEERVTQAFHSMRRSNYPSAYVYSTGQWHKYKDLLAMAFALTKDGRAASIYALFDFGLNSLEENTYYQRAEPRVRLFDLIVDQYPRSGDAENGGLTFQAIVFGFLAAEYPHLFVLADKVRTGSSRQHRIGDVDLYSGLDLELSAEVKDMVIDNTVFDSQLGSFIENVKIYGTLGLVFCQDIVEECKDVLLKNSCSVFTNNNLIDAISLWDWPKQNTAVNAFLHFLAHIEQNPKAVMRALTYIKGVSPQHDSLAYLSK